MTKLGLVMLVIASACAIATAQSDSATISGRIVDPSGAVVVGAQVQVVNIETSIANATVTNAEGFYLVPNLRAGRYRIIIKKEGFQQIVKTEIVLHVQDVVAENFHLAPGAISESVTVTGDELRVNTEDATVGTVVDRNFAENLPMNGRSFQTLIQLTPGVVLTANNRDDTGQFSVNGQRAASNYWMVDGVSANIGISATANGNAGNGLAGAAASFSAQGGTNSLVSVDALQEFRIETSTYAAEFGRTPGGQISIVTRSGTNQFHGSVFDYLRNGAFDANDWFADNLGLPKPNEHQNDFGGTLSGPIRKDRTFFFFSYEGLRLRLPEVALSDVPDLNARQNASAAMKPYLNALPLPNGPDDPATGIAQFNASFANRSTLDAYSLRLDHRLTDKLTLFGRYNYSPSELDQRGFNGDPDLSTVSPSKIRTQTATVGATWLISPTISNDLRFNYSRTSAFSFSYLDNFGGAVPLTSLPFPSPFDTQNGSFSFDIFAIANGGFFSVGPNLKAVQRQINIVDSLTAQIGSHTLKFGVDFRRLSPFYGPAQYTQGALFNDVPSAQSGTLLASILGSSINGTLLFRNLGLFAQDTWRVKPRLTLTYGVRWDVDFAPGSISGPGLIAVTGFNLNNLSQLALAKPGTPPYQTTYGNLAPRIGVAYQLSQAQNRQTVLRGGFGVFYDLASSEVGNNVFGFNYPFGSQQLNFGGTFPLASTAPPPITPPGPSSVLYGAFDPHLKLPYTLQWNVALEQGLGKEQTISASYIGSAGRRLLGSADISSPNSNLGTAILIGNVAVSDYNAVQVQLQRQLSHGLQALASYTWSHSIDTASAGSYGNGANTFLTSAVLNGNRGPSDFDIRNAFTAGLTYDISSPKVGSFIGSLLHEWSVQNIVQVRSAPPVNVYDGNFVFLGSGYTHVRPDLAPGLPLYLYGSQYPGGKAFNNTPNEGGPGCVGPFCPPPTDSNGAPLRQGNLGRNALRGFGAAQWDFAVHRDFRIREPLKLQFRAEMFNVLNHPSFGQPVADTANTQFGQSTQLLGQYLGGGNTGSGAFSPLYQIGGPRSIQLALKLLF